MKSLSALLFCVSTLSIFAAEPAPEAVLPENTVLAVSVPDFAQSRAAYQKSRLAAMFSEPEMQQFLAPACEQMRKSYDDLRAKNPLLPALADLEQLFTGDVTLAFYERNADNGETPAGLIVMLRPRDLAAFNRIVPPDVLPLNPDNPMAPAMAQLKGRVVLVFPGEDLNGFEQRFNEAPAHGTLAAREGFSSARKQVQFAGGYLFADPAGIMNLALKSGQFDGKAAAAIQKANKALGIDGISGVMLGAGFNQDEIVLEGCMRAVPGRRPGGLLGLLLSPDQPAEPISRAAMKLAAPGAPFVCAGRVDFAGLLAKVRMLLAVADLGRQVDSVLMLLNMQLGFNLDKDLLANLGTETVYAQSPLDTALPLSWGFGGVTSIALRDAEKVEGCFQKLAATFGSRPENPIAQMLQFRKSEYKGKTIYHVKQLMSSSWSFCIYGDRLLAGNSLNAVKRAIEQLAGGTDILSVPDFQATLARISGQPFNADKLPAGFAYQTDQGGGGGSLALVSLGLAGGASGLAGLAELTERQPDNFGGGGDPLVEIGRFLERPSGKVLMSIGSSIDLGLWPDEGFFVQHRRARGAYWSSDPLSMYFRTELPFPAGGMRSGGGGPLMTVAVVGIAAGLVLPVLGRSREAARRASSANNLGQMGKAMIMFADVPANAEYPKDPADLYPDYVADPRIFKNPRFADQDVGYIYIPGSSPNDAMTMVAFENVPVGDTNGRNILLGAGSVEWRDEGSFQEELKKTEEALKANGIEIKQIPISQKAIAEKKR
jgi:type II secretory pathway pseudopilin PulG